MSFGIGRFITNQQNIYRVTPVHYLQRQRKRHEKEQQHNNFVNNFVNIRTGFMKKTCVPRSKTYLLIPRSDV